MAGRSGDDRRSGRVAAQAAACSSVLLDQASAKAATTAGSNCVPAQRSSSARASPGVHARAVGAVGDHRVEGVADGDDARAERDLLAGEAVGVAARRPSARGWSARARRPGASAGRGGDDPLADERVAAHELPLVVVERRRACRGSRRGSRPCRRRAARRRGGRGRSRSSSSPSAPRDGLGELGDAAEVLAELGVALGERAQQHVAGSGCAPSVRPPCLWAYMRWSAMRSASPASVASRGQRDDAVRAADREALAVLGERRGGSRDDRLGELGAGVEQHAELVAAHPVGAAARRRRAREVARRGAASSASPAGWPKVSL